MEVCGSICWTRGERTVGGIGSATWRLRTRETLWACEVLDFRATCFWHVEVERLCWSETCFGSVALEWREAQVVICEWETVTQKQVEPCATVR